MDYKGKIITKNPVEPSQTSAPGVWTLNDATQAIKENNWPIANVLNPISRSLRFNSADSTYLNRTFTTPTNNKIFTFSAWVKRSQLGANQRLFAVNNDFIMFGYGGSDELRVSLEGGPNYDGVTTSRLFRDTSAWYHIVIAVDTTQATAANRVKFYVNGVQETSFSRSNYPSQNQSPTMNSAVAHFIGMRHDSSEYLNGYMTEIHFVDGQQLDASSFGLTDPRTGAWIPKAVSGITYGTNGFYLNFSDNSTTAALGTDSSGNNNTWTTNNFSVTAGSGNDSMVDVPTPWIPYNTTGDVGGVVRGNYATLNPLDKTVGTLTNGNLDCVITTVASPTQMYVNGTMGVSSGKWYWEMSYVSGSSEVSVGVIKTNSNFDTMFLSGVGYFALNGQKYVDGTNSSYGATYTSGDVIGVALDVDGGTVTFYKNNTSQGAISLPSGVSAWKPAFANGTRTNNQTITVNFGQRPFAYTPPAGFLSLCTTNLPEPTILDGGDYFNAVTYTGDYPNNTSVTVGFAPDFVWAKSRTQTYSHYLFNSLTSGSNFLQSNNTNAEGTSGDAISFDANGFTVTAGQALNEGGQGANNMVSWNWKESATSGFDIVTYTGDGTSGRTVAHNLGVTPNFLIFKNRSSTDGWIVFTSAITATTWWDTRLLLASTAAAASGAGYLTAEPTSSVLTLGSGSPVNANANNYIAYLFAAVPGFSAFGSYTGTSVAEGPFIYTGFRPAFILIKNITTTWPWVMIDAARSSYNLADDYLLANASDAEVVDASRAADFLSNGFKIRGDSSFTNSSSSTMIYAAFAENPFKYSNAR